MNDYARGYKDGQKTATEIRNGTIGVSDSLKLLSDLLNVLSPHFCERGYTESVVDTLKRIIRERNNCYNND